MSTESISVPVVPTHPLPVLRRASRALGSEVRWRILRELSLGDQLMPVELADRLKLKRDNVAHHLMALRKAGLVVNTRAGLNLIPKHCLPVPGKRIVDYGHCILRLDADTGQS